MKKASPKKHQRQPRKSQPRPVEPTKARKIRTVLEKQQDYTNLGNIMTEFLNSFVVVGYDFEGNAINICNYKNTQEYNSLSVLVHDYLVQLNNSQQSEG